MSLSPKLTRPIAVGPYSIGGQNPIVLIGGPCVIESEQKVMGIAEKLKRITSDKGVPFIFKASYDKANRSSIQSFRGPGLQEGLKILEKIKTDLDLPILSDIHKEEEVEPAAEVLDILQIPAFLCRQTDLLVKAAHSGKPVNVKKGQFMAPWDMKNVVLKLTQTGNKNVLLGAETTVSAAAATNEIVIGYNATGLGDNYAVIGNTDVTRLYAAQDGAAQLYANGTIQSSDRRIKKNIEEIGYGLDYVMSLRPVTYFKKHPGEYSQDLKDKFYPDGDVRQVRSENEGRRQVGFIAQEVQAVNAHFGVENNIVAIDEDGFHRMDYEKLVVPVVRGLQELDTVVLELKATVQARDAVIATQQAQLEAMLARVAALERQFTE